MVDFSRSQPPLSNKAMLALITLFLSSNQLSCNTYRLFSYKKAINTVSHIIYSPWYPTSSYFEQSPTFPRHFQKQVFIAYLPHLVLTPSNFVLVNKNFHQLSFITSCFVRAIIVNRVATSSVRPTTTTMHSHISSNLIITYLSTQRKHA